MEQRIRETELSCDGCIARRSFIAQGTLAAAALLLAACGDESISEPPASVGSSIRIADHPPLATVGGVALVTVNGAQLAIVRVSTTSFIALSRRCPHQGGTINTISTGFRCTRHGATFDRNGSWVGGQNTTSMRSFATSFNAASGTLTIS